MYSPKIEETLVPVLYHTAKDRGIPMTRLVSILIGKALSSEALPISANVAMREFIARSQTQNATK